MWDTTVARINELKGNMSQEEFAKSIHTSQSNISKVLNGNPPSTNTLLEIAKQYNVSVDWLLGLSDKKNVNEKLSDTNLTYAEVITVFHLLLENNSIRMTDVYHPAVSINDPIIEHILRSRRTVEKLDTKMRTYWHNSTVENFGTRRVLKWNSELDRLSEQHLSESSDDAAFVHFIDLFS